MLIMDNLNKEEIEIVKKALIEYVDFNEINKTENRHAQMGIEKAKKSIEEKISFNNKVTEIVKKI